MHLKSLTLKGFKSFAQPTVFAFEPGVTCVIGPNGSGKSNVVDALAWVMGEQGAKTLRGGKMDDVIFAGTANKGPLGRAEVVLTIDNSDGALPIEYAEVTIRRTLFRGGGSEYAINGSGCRLLDVQELLSDSGLGREMHVIVGQGQLDAVLHASAEDRRGFIEEAAGILKHRRRKEKTQRKLEAMQVNLTRLSDLAGEIRRQLKPLGHQAEIAREAQTIASVVRDARARLLADDVVTLRETIGRQTRGESERKTERVVLQEQLDGVRLRTQRIEQHQVGDAVDVARRTAFALESQQSRLRSLLTLASQRLALLGQQSEAVDQQPGTTPQAVAGAEEEARLLREQVVGVERGWKEARAATVAARAELDALDEHISAQSALVSRHDLEVSGLAGRAEAAASRLAAVRGERLRQENALDGARTRRDTARAAFAELEAEAALADTGETDADARYDTAQADVAEAETAMEALRDELHARERERDALAARRTALDSALSQKDGSSALVGAGLDGIRGLVAEHMRVRPGYEAAVAAALGPLADAVLAADRDSAVAGVARAVDDDLGRVDIVVADARSTGAAAVRADGCVPAVDVVEAPDGVLALLAGVVVADDLAAARRAWGGLGDDATVITRAGEVLSRYVLRGGSGATRSRLELVADRDAASHRLDEVTGAIDRGRFALAEQRGVHAAAREQAARALAELRDLDAQLAARTERLGRARVQVEAAHAETERLEKGLAESAAAVTEAESALDRARQELDVARERPRPILDVAERDALAEALDRAREGEVEARLEVETARERARAEEARAASLARALQAERARAEEAARRAVVRRGQMRVAESVLAALPPVLASADRSAAEARVELTARERDRAQQNEELAALRRDETALRERLHAISDDVHTLEMQLYESRLHLTALLERATAELGLVEDVLVAEYGPRVPVPADDAPADASDAPAGETSGEPSEEAPGVPYVRAEQERRLARAERKLGQLGRVNPLALEEFAALEQRHRFLTEQLADLTSTRKDLLTIIEEIDERMQSIFLSAFEDTRAAFDRVFPVLFPGGSGSIRLTDPDDLLTTGIDVQVRPAGKKIERLSLLSGGERSLAAVALLIAIFKARPSPFYIMDEVEAALDDANLGRLLTIFEDLRQSSQLIVITHQKRTMEIADALYGVSMRADGISAVVGQRVAQHDAPVEERERRVS